MRVAIKGFIWKPAYVLVGAAAALTLLAPFYFAMEADDSAQQREEAQVANGIDGRINEIAGRTVAETVWDEAVIHLDNAYDPAWADSYVGSYFYSSEGFETALVVDRDGTTIYAMKDGVTVDPDTMTDVRVAAEPRLLEVRAAEAAADPLEARVADGRTLSDPILATGLSRVGGEAYILTATLVQPDFGAASPLEARSAVVVVGERLDEAFADVFATRYLLTDARLVPPSALAGPHRASVTMRGDDNEPLMRLEWRASRPSAMLLAKALPPTLVMVIALGLLAALLHRRQRRALEGLIASEVRATRLAYHDVLTGLPNRMLLAERTARSIDAVRGSGAAFAMHVIDLDRFKEVNETFGSRAGDEIVRQAGRALKEICGPSDTLARLGADEFALVQADATSQSASACAARIVEQLTRTFEVDGVKIPLGASVGVALIDDASIDWHQCLRRADFALAHARSNGRGQWSLYDAEADVAVRNRWSLRNDLRDALEAEALKVVYQPQVNGRGRMSGVETLVRWSHPVHGAVSPAIFVPIAEEAGLIDELGFLTLRRAFADSWRWPGLQVAVNVSASQLFQPGFAARMARLIAETGVNPGRFELEVTEGVLLGEDSTTVDTLRELRRMGFQIALDDFGTGFSSLSYLKRYPIDKIKIDRSFITNLDIDPEACAVVSAIVKLARALGLGVIAEGVETTVQRERLAEVGCADVQGFLYGRPVDADEIDILVAEDNLRSPGRRALAA